MSNDFRGAKIVYNSGTGVQSVIVLRLPRYGMLGMACIFAFWYTLVVESILVQLIIFIFCFIQFWDTFRSSYSLLKLLILQIIKVLVLMHKMPVNGSLYLSVTPKFYTKQPV